MFAIDGECRLSFATEGFAARLDATPGALTGRPLDAVIETEDNTDIAAVISELQTARAGVSRRRRLALVTGRKSDPVAVEFTATESQQVVGTVRERSDVDGRYRHLFQQSTDAIVSFEIVEMEPIVRAVNTAFVETFGYERTQILGEPLNEYIVPEENAKEAANYDRRTAAGETNEALITRKTVDGKRAFLYRGLSYQTADNRRWGFAIYADVTDDRQLQRRLQVLHRVLRHNLRNDLTVITGMADHIYETADGPEQRQAAEKILSTAERLSSVSEQARDLEVALDSDSEQSVDAAELSRSVVESYAGKQIETEMPDAAPVTGGTAVYDAIDNLVENAIVHTPAGTDIRVTIDTEGDETCIRVADSGPGIEAIERAAVFEDQDITRLRHGSGLGLWLARWVAEAAGGECQYERVDGWTVIELWLPSVDSCTQLIPDGVGESSSAATGQ